MQTPSIAAAEQAPASEEEPSLLPKAPEGSNNLSPESCLSFPNVLMGLILGGLHLLNPLGGLSLSSFALLSMAKG